MVKIRYEHQLVLTLIFFLAFSTAGYCKDLKINKKIKSVLQKSLPDAVKFLDRGSPKDRELMNLKGRYENLLKKLWSNMVKVEAGYFPMGCDPQRTSYCKKEANPQKNLFLDTFYIDAYEVSVRDYERCVKIGACSPTPVTTSAGATCNWKFRNKRKNHPINCVTFTQAKKYCNWLGKNLPTEAQWEKTARTYEGRLFVWGNILKCNPACTSLLPDTYPTNLNCIAQTHFLTCPVGSYKTDISGYGVFDLTGNVMEWVSDWKRDYSSGKIDSSLKVIRGGSFLSSAPGDLFTFERKFAPPDSFSEKLGFRCSSTEKKY